MYWACTYQLYVQGLLLNPTPEIVALGERFRDLNARVQQMFIDWSMKVPPRAIYVRGDLTRMHFLQFLHLDLAARRSPEQAMEAVHKNLDRFEEWAQVLFWQAVEECYPDHPILKERPWIDAWKISLEPEKWDEEGLFHPASAPRPLRLHARKFHRDIRPAEFSRALRLRPAFPHPAYGPGLSRFIALATP